VNGPPIVGTTKLHYTRWRDRTIRNREHGAIAYRAGVARIRSDYAGATLGTGIAERGQQRRQIGEIDAAVGVQVAEAWR